jgi:hypothetical protein
MLPVGVLDAPGGVHRLEGSMCYHGGTMAGRTKESRSSERAGRTEKISISIDRLDLEALRRRAKQLYDGNLSAAVAEGARRIREQEAREALVAWLGPASEATPEEREAIRAEWRGTDRPARGRRRGAA